MLTVLRQRSIGLSNQCPNGLNPHGQLPHVIDSLDGAYARDLCASDPGRWPLLIRAYASMKEALSTKIEWFIEDTTRKCDMGHTHSLLRTNYNYTQIFWTPLRYPSMKQQALEELFDNIESAFRSGHRSANRGGYPSLTLGGVNELLGHWPHRHDTLGLYVLRDLTYRIDKARDTSEWLVELSLMAIAGGKS